MFRKIFSCNSGKVEVICETKEIKGLITRWTQSECWKFKNFAEFIKKIGIKTPIKLSELKNNTIKCITALNTEVTISLYFGDLDMPPAIYVTEGVETRKYSINTNREWCKNKFKKGNLEPKVTLIGRDIKSNGKELSNFYSEFYCSRTLKNGTRTLKIEILKSVKFEKESKIFLLRNCEAIEKYLLGLQKNVEIDEVYNTLLRYLGLSENELLNDERISISYYEEEQKNMNKKILICGNRK